MTSFLAIVKLTCRSTVRSHVFRTLFVLLLLAILLIPNTVKSDGTASGFIQLILEYSLGITSAILIISSAWVICFEVCSDIENGQIALLTVKPVSRLKLLLGKVTGVLLIHTILLVFSYAAVYGLMMYQFNRQDFTDADRKHIHDEVFCGRRVYEPVRKDYEKLAEEELKRRLSKASKQDLQNLAMRTDGRDRNTMLADIRKELQGADSEVAPGHVITWDFDGIEPVPPGAPVFLKYTVLSPESASKGDPSFGQWFFRLVMQKDETADPDSPKKEFVETFVPTAPDDVPLSSVREIPVQRQILRTFNPGMTADTPIPEDVMVRLTGNLIEDGHFRVSFRSFDKKGKKLVFQEPDGPFLLIRETGFLNNYLRALAVSFFGLATVTLIAGGISSCFVLPVALFITASYGLLCVIANYLFRVLQYTPGELTGAEHFGFIFSRILLFFMIPFQNFFLSSYLSGGQLIEWSEIGSLFLFGLVCRGLVLFLLCSFFYKRKEIALFMKR